MSKIINTHCHIHDWGAITNIIARAAAYNVVGIICNSVTPDDWAPIVNAVSKHPEIYGAIGIHPWHMSNPWPNWDARMRDILMRHADIMIGEIGLDINHPEIDNQIKICARQLAIAREFRRVAQIHCVGAWDIMTHQLFSHDLPIIMHSFGGSVEIMRAIDRKCDAYFSISPSVLRPEYRRMRECVTAMPMGRILVESDDDDSSVIPRIISEIANIRGIDVDEMTDIIYNNTKRVLGHG